MEIEALLQQLQQTRSTLSELKSLESKLIEEIHRAQPTPKTFKIGNKKYSIRKEYPSLRIKDKDLIPDDFLSQSPDRSKIRNHFLETGEVLPGAEIKINRGAIKITNAGQ